MKDNSSLKKFVFFLIVFAIGGGALAWGIRQINETQSEYSAAVSTVSDLGFLSRKIISYTNELPSIRNEKSYNEQLRKVKALVRQMEMKHLSLFKGNPGFSSDNRFARQIKTAYFALPEKTIAQVRDFLDHTDVLLETPYAEFSARNPELAHLKAAVQGELTRAINHTIHSLRKVGDDTIYEQTTILIVSLVAIVLIAFLRYLNMLQKQRQPIIFSKVKIPYKSAASILKDFSARNRPEVIVEAPAVPRNGNGKILNGTRPAHKKAPIISPIRVKMDVTV